MSDEKVKRIIPIMLICLFMNIISFVPVSANSEEEEDMPVLSSYNFDDGQLPASFSSYTFKVEEGELRVFGKWSKFSFSDIPRNCSLEFKIKPIENRIIPRFYVKLRDEAIFYYSNNALVGGDTSSQFYLVSASDNQQKGESFKSDTNILSAGGEYTVKYVAQGSDYSVYLDGEQIISASYETESGVLNSGVEFGCMPEDDTEGIIGFYLDDVVVSGKSSELDVPVDSLYACNFENGQLPNGFNAEKYSIENGECFINGKACTFSYSGLSRDCSLEFRIKPKDNYVIPNFNVLIGNGSFTYVANYAENPDWDDRLVMYNAETWGEYVSEKWAKDTFFVEKQRGHKIKFVAEGDLHSLYMDDVLMLSAECPIIEEKEGYDITFTLTGKDKFDNVGFYLDDIVVKGKLAGADTLAEVLCEYNFDDGIIPSEFSAASFKVKDGRIVSTATGSSFSIPNVPKNSYVEFKIGATPDNVLPGLSTTFGNASFNYIANFVQNSNWNDRLTMTNATTGTQVVDSWAVDSFFSVGENTVKYFTDGEMYSMYINGKKIASGECKSNVPKGRFTFTLRSGDAGNMPNTEFYVDDIVVKTLKGNANEETTENGQVARVLKDTWKTETDSAGVNYAGFDVVFNVPEGMTVDSFWVKVNGKNSKLIKIDPIEGEKVTNIPVVMKYEGSITAEDVKIYVK